MNKIILEGRAGRDPETRFSKEGTAITTLSLATSNDYKDQNGDWVKKEPDWHNVVAFGDRANRLAAFRKGDKITVEGKLTYDQWEDKSGKRVTAKVIAFVIRDPESRRAEDSAPPDDDQGVPF